MPPPENNIRNASQPDNEGVVIEDLEGDSPLADIINTAMGNLRKVTLSRRDALHTALFVGGFALGAVSEKQGHVLERVQALIVPTPPTKHPKSIALKRVPSPEEMSDAQTHWISEITAKSAIVDGFYTDLFPAESDQYAKAYSDEQLNHQLETYSQQNQLYASLSQLQGLVGKIQNYRHARNEKLSFEDLLHAYALTSSSSDPTSTVNKTTLSEKTMQQGTCLQTVDYFLSSLEIARTAYLSGKINAGKYTQFFNNTLNMAYITLNQPVPQGDLKENAIQFVATSLGVAAGIT